MQPPTDLRRLEELGLNSSAPPGQLLYDGWLLRLLPGQAKRARSVNAVYPSLLPLPVKVAYCEQLYRGHDLPVVFRITPFSEPATLDAELERLGYDKFDVTSVEATTIVPDKLLHYPTEGLELPHGWKPLAAYVARRPTTDPAIWSACRARACNMWRWR